MASFRQIACLLLFVSASALARGGRRDRCENIVPFCANLTKAYTRMRLPNFLGHDEESDVTDGLSNWNPLVGATAKEFHCPARLLKIFLCSIYAPVCMDRNIDMKIGPCQSLCVKARDSCSPVMKEKANMSWPSANNAAFNCSSYIDNSMCIKEENDKEGVDILCSADLTIDELLKESCASEFALKINLIAVRHKKESKGSNKTTFLRTTLVKVSQSRNHKKPEINVKNKKQGTLRMSFPTNSGGECHRVVQSSKSSGRNNNHYLVAGKYEDGGKNGKKKMIVTLVLKWKKTYRRLLKRNACSQH